MILTMRSIRLWFRALQAIGLCMVIAAPLAAVAEERADVADQIEIEDEAVDEAELLKDCEPFPFGKVGEPSGSYREFHGQPIRAIQFMRINVFDPNNPRENNALYRFMNRLHINTKESVVDAQLLFSRGDTLNAGEVAETERNLRALPYLSYAAIHVGQVCQEGVVLLVVTRDVWTTEPIFNYSREGGDTETGFGFKEGNLLGTGTTLSLVFDKSAERSSTQYTYSSPHLFNSHWRFKIGFAESSDGQETAFQLDRPFYALSSDWAAGYSNVDTTLTEKIRFGDEIIDGYKHEEDLHELYAGIGLGFDGFQVHRLTIGMSQARDLYYDNQYTESPVPVDTNMVFPWFQYHYLQDVFEVYRNLDLLHRVEDVSLGMDIRVRLGYGGSTFGNDEDFTYLNAEYNDTLGVGLHHLIKLNTLIDGSFNASSPDYEHSVWGGGVRYYYLSGSAHRYFAHLRYDQGHNLLPHDQLTAGGVNGLRGYPLDYQRGEKRLLLSLENRYVTPWHIFNLLRVGAVAFVDAGRAWGGGYDKTHTLANVGVGLRFSSSKAKLDNIAHLDLAFPLVDKDLVDEYQLVMKVESHF